MQKIQLLFASTGVTTSCWSLGITLKQNKHRVGIFVRNIPNSFEASGKRLLSQEKLRAPNLIAFLPPDPSDPCRGCDIPVLTACVMTVCPRSVRKYWLRAKKYNSTKINSQNTNSWCDASCLLIQIHLDSPFACQISALSFILMGSKFHALGRLRYVQDPCMVYLPT